MIQLDPDLETKFQIHHCSKNVIDLIEDDLSESLNYSNFKNLKVNPGKI